VQLAEHKRALRILEIFDSPVNIKRDSDRYDVSAIKVADWGNVAICDKQTNKVVCHFIHDNDFDENKETAEKITKFLNV
jgi:hypothetical protein